MKTDDSLPSSRDAHHGEWPNNTYVIKVSTCIFYKNRIYGGIEGTWDVHGVIVRDIWDREGNWDIR